MKGKRKVKERVLAWYLVLLMVVSIIPFNMFKMHARADVQSNSYTITVKNQDGELLDDVSIEYVVKLGTETKANRTVVTTTGVAGISEITDDLLNKAQTASKEVTVDITAKKKGYKEYSNAGISVTASIKNVDVQMTAKQADDTFAFEKTTAAIKYGDSFSNTASSTKKRTGTVNYSVVSGDDCVSVDSDGVITTLKSGAAKIKAVLLEDDAFQESEAFYDLTVNKANDSNFVFAVPAPDPIIYSVDGTFSNTASGGSGTGSISYEILNGNDYASIDTDGTLHFTKAGTVTVKATKASDDKYNEISAEYTIEIKKASQNKLSFENEAPSDVTITDGTFSNAVSGGTGDGQITYEIVSGLDYASVDDVTLPVITLKKAGTITVKATKAADDRYEEESATYNLTIKKAQQAALTFVAINPEITYAPDWTYTVSVAGGSGTGALSYYILDNGNNVTENDIASIDIVTGVVSKKGYKTGVVKIVAVKAADDSYEATSVTNDLTIKKAEQTGVQFDKNSDSVTYGDNNNEYANQATGGESTGKIVYSIESVDNTLSGVPCASLDQDTGKVTVKGSGKIKIKAVKQGDDCYEDSEAVYYTLIIAKAEQQNFKFADTVPTSVTYNENNNEYVLAATGGNGNGAVTYKVVSGDAVEISGNKLTVKKSGTAVIRVDKAESDGYLAAFDEIIITVAKAEQAIKFNDTATSQVVYGNVFSNEAVPVVNNSVPDGKGYAADTVITYEVVVGNNIANVDTNGKLTFKNGSIGTVTVKASKLGNSCYEDTECEYTIEVVYLATPQIPYTLSGEKKNDDGWYTGNVTITPATGYKISYSNDLTNNDWKDSIEVSDEGLNAKAIYLKNDSGITGAIKINENDIKIDKTKPENLKVSYSKSVPDTILEKIFKFYKAPVTVTLEAKDVTSGIKNFTYSYEVEKDASKVNTGVSDVVAAVGDKGVTISGSSAKAVFEINAQFRGKVSFTATDNAGNVSDICKDNKTIVVDNKAPIVEITLVEPKNEKYYSDYPVTANIKINEANFFAEAFEKVEDISVNPSELVDEHLKITVTTELNNGTKTEKVYKNDDLTTKFKKGDADEWNSTIKFDTGEDAIYTIKVECTDFSGNKAETAEKTFIVDKKDPCINVDFSNNDVRNGKYFNADRTAKITIKERNFNAADVELNVTADKAVGNIADYAEYLKNSDNWTNTGDTHTAEITFSTEAFYKFDISYTDMSGRKNEPVNYGDSKAATDFVIDKTAPVNSDIKINDSSVLARGGVAFEKFYRNDVTVKFSTNADISGIKSVKYQKVNDLSSYNKNGTWNEYDSQNGVVVKPNEKFVIYFMVEDMAGNTVIVNSTGIVVDDKAPIGEKAAPEIDIIPDAANANGLHNGNVNVAMKVVDPKYSGVNSDINGYYSGINKITYRIYTRDTDAVETGTLMDISANNTNGAVFDKDNLISSWSGNITVDASRFNSNNVVVEVKAVDNAGNERVTTNEMIGQAIKIDITAPAIDVSYDNNTADNNTYFKENRTARIQITERNFNENDVDVRISNTDGVIPSVSGWTQYAGSGNMDNTTWVTYVTYDADGDYKFDISYKDMADNTAGAENYADGTVAAKEFTVDKTNPVIEVSYDNNDAENSNYYKADRTATISVTEHNFQADRVIVNVTATDDGNAVTAPQISGWTSDGDINTATIYYGSDAYYTFNISMQDMAGNSSDEFTEQNFYVDKTVPELSISGVENNTANSGTVIPVISYSDTNYDESLVLITLTGANRKTVELDGSYAEQHNGRVFTFKDFANEKSIDDIYTLTASITDRAGNVSTQTVVFSVNRFGSTYELSSSTENLNGTYVKSTEDVVLSEVNVNQLTNIKLTLYKNDATIVLKENEDYRVSISGGNGQWYQYTYTVFAKNFSENGVYRITVQSDDATGRTQKTDQDTKNIEIQFGIDNEPPVINVKNLESKTTYAMESKEVEMTVRDNLKLGQVIVELDGNEYKTWSGDELEQIVQNGGNFTFNIDGNTTSAHNIVVYASDAAGNGAKTANADKPANVVNIDDFYVTTNKWVQYINNKPLFYGSIIAVIAVVGLGVFAVTFVRRKKDKAEK